MTTAYNMFLESESHSHTQISWFWIWLSTTVTTKTKKAWGSRMFCAMKATHHALQR